MCLEGVGQRLPVEHHVPILDLPEQGLDSLDIEHLSIELATEFGVHDEPVGQPQGGRGRGMNIRQEPEQRGVTIADLPVSVMNVFARRGQDLVQHPPLLVPKQVLERVIGLAEIPVHQANHPWKIGALEGFVHLAHQLGVGLGPLVRPHPAVEIVIAQVEHAIADHVGVLGNLEPHPGPTQRQPGVAHGEDLPILLLHGVGVDLGRLRIRLEQRTDCIVRPHPFAVHDPRFDEIGVDASSVPKLPDVAAGLLQETQELRLQILAQKVGRELNGAGGVLDDLHGLDARQLIEKPAAACEHEHGVTLQLQETHGRDLTLRLEVVPAMAFEKRLPILRRPVQQKADVVIARLPGIPQELSGPFFVKWRQLVSEPVQGVTQRLAPVLVPARPPARVAAAMFDPTIDPMTATPSAGRVQPRFPLWRMFFQKLTVIGQPRQALGLDSMQRIRQGHFTLPMMMAVGLAVGGDVHQLIALAILVIAVQ